ncbi:Uncharacterised protein [Mycobacteroides abscessus subsp. abscessus]|nr:Uncharacterised protein [Mycobacteroides abscessus subsp. abscessus]
MGPAALSILAVSSGSLPSFSASHACSRSCSARSLMRSITRSVMATMVRPPRCPSMAFSRSAVGWIRLTGHRERLPAENRCRPSVANRESPREERRCGGGRRRFRRVVCPAAAAIAGVVGRRVRSRLGCRRHVVLQPLPRRPLRCGEHRLLLFVLRRAATGVGLDRKVRRPKRNSALHQPCRRPLRPAP